MASKMPTKVLVTGGAGFIGSAVCRYLVRDMGFAVVNIDALTYAGNLASLGQIDRSPLYCFEQCNILDAAKMGDVLRQHQPDAVIHLAAESHVDRSIDGAAIFLQTNILGTWALLEAVRTYLDDVPFDKRDAFRMLHVSTDEVYGSLGIEGHFTEQTAYDPSSPYSASKAASDHLVVAWTKTYGLPCIITNCSNNYGPYQFPEKFIPLTILNALQGKHIGIYGSGQNIRDWLHVDDHVKALVEVLLRGRIGEKYNIGGRNERTNLQVAEQICELLDQHAPKTFLHRSLIQFVPDRPGHDYRYAIDSTKIETEIGWRTEETFEFGIEKTVLWYASNENWWAPLRERAYGRNL